MVNEERKVSGLVAARQPLSGCNDGWHEGHVIVEQTESPTSK